jgi:hypothetical protein
MMRDATFDPINISDSTTEYGYSDMETFYRWALLIVEIFGFALYFLSLIYLKKTFNTFHKNEFDMIRTGFRGDFYNLQRDSDFN